MTYTHQRQSTQGAKNMKKIADSNQSMYTGSQYAR